MFGLDRALEDFSKFTEKEKKPTELEMIYYLFWEKGISLKELIELPLPYIFGITGTFSYVKKEEEKAFNKANKK